MNQVNLNQYVQFKAKDEKAAAFLQETMNKTAERNGIPDKFKEKLENLKVETGHYKIQLHAFCFYFGDIMYNGAPELIKDNTIIT